MARASNRGMSDEQAPPARLARGKLQKARTKGLPALSATEYQSRLRRMVPEALEALAAALKNPRERIAAAKVVLERAFPPSVIAALESAGPTRFTICFDRPGDAPAVLADGKTDAAPVSDDATPGVLPPKSVAFCRGWRG